MTSPHRRAKPGNSPPPLLSFSEWKRGAVEQRNRPFGPQPSRNYERCEAYQRAVAAPTRLTVPDTPPPPRPRPPTPSGESTGDAAPPRRACTAPRPRLYASLTGWPHQRIQGRPETPRNTLPQQAPPTRPRQIHERKGESRRDRQREGKNLSALPNRPYPPL